MQRGPPRRRREPDLRPRTRGGVDQGHKSKGLSAGGRTCEGKGLRDNSGIVQGRVKMDQESGEDSVGKKMEGQTRLGRGRNEAGPAEHLMLFKVTKPPTTVTMQEHTKKQKQIFLSEHF